jgi:hypothetical protein
MLMLTLSADILPRTDLTYLAFRAAFMETLERIVLSRQVSVCGEWVFGYLTEVPVLTQVAPQVQLDLLLDTWQRHVRTTEYEATLLDEAIVFSVCETAARLLRNDRPTFKRIATTGPQPWRGKLGLPLVNKLVDLHTSLTRDADFLLIGQFLDLPPREAKLLKQEFGLHPRDAEPLFDALGRWGVRGDFEARGSELLTAQEAATVQTILEPYIPRAACR